MNARWNDTFFHLKLNFQVSFVQIRLNWKIVSEAETKKISILDRNSI